MVHTYIYCVTLSIVVEVDGFLLLDDFLDNLCADVLPLVGLDISSSLLALANASSTLRVW